MSMSSFEEGTRLAGHYAISSSSESTASTLCSLPSDSSDVQTETTPPTSPTPSEGKMRTPRDILDASRRLGQISLRGDPDMTPSRPHRQVHYRASSQSVVANSDEAGYDADGDGDGDGNGSGGRSGGGGGGARVCADTTTTTTTRLVRRPGFLRIDTRQHRRVASMLATGTRRPTSPNVCDSDADVPRRPRGKLPSIHLLKSANTTATTAGKGNDRSESYELRPRPRAEPVGLGIGFPENHPLRSRAFSMPVPTSASPISDLELDADEKWGQGGRSEWLPSGSTSRCHTTTRWMKQPTQVRVHAPSPVRLALRPTFLEMSPSPIECLPARPGS